MFFTPKKVIRTFYLNGSEEIDIFQNSEGEHELPVEVFAEYAPVFNEMDNGEVRLAQNEAANGTLTASV